MSEQTVIASTKNEVILQKGIRLAGVFYKKVTLKSPVLGDMIEADSEAAEKGNLAYQAALVARCISSINGLPDDTVFSASMLNGLCPADWLILRKKMNEIESEGED